MCAACNYFHVSYLGANVLLQAELSKHIISIPRNEWSILCSFQYQLLAELVEFRFRQSLTTLTVVSVDREELVASLHFNNKKRTCSYHQLENQGGKKETERINRKSNDLADSNGRHAVCIVPIISPR